LAIYIFSGVVYAQTSQIPQNITDSGVQLTQQSIDANNAKIQALTTQIANDQGTANTYLAKVASEQSQITAIQATNIQLESSLTALATQTPPIQSALDLLNSNPSYGINWTSTVTLITDPNAINWTDITDLHLQGLNWSSIQAIHSGVNWTAVDIANGTAGVNWSGVNWYTISNCLSNGVNWNTAVINGTC
jgi:hypothetical protein